MNCQAFPCHVWLIQPYKLESSCRSNHSAQDKEDVSCVQTEIKNSISQPSYFNHTNQIHKHDLRGGFIKCVRNTCRPSDVCWGDIHLLGECGVKGEPAVSRSSSDKFTPHKNVRRMDFSVRLARTDGEGDETIMLRQERSSALKKNNHSLGRTSRLS